MAAMWSSLVIAFVITAAIADVRWHKIPRALSVVGLVVGLIVHAHLGDLTSALLASLIGFAVGIVLFSLGAIGGGDVKLVIALGGMLGFVVWSKAMFIAVLAAAAIGLVQVIVRGRLMQTLRNVLEILKALFRGGLHAHPELHVKNAALVRTPFGVAAAIGTVLAIVR